MLNPANNTTRYAAFVSIVSMLILFGLGTYLTSYLKGEISQSLFTVSQSLAFGNQPVVILLLTTSIILLGYINIIRGPSKLLWLRQFLLLLVYGMVITLLWVTTYYSTIDHYILATIIFISIVVYINITSILYYKNIKNVNIFNKVILILLSSLSIIVLIGLAISKFEYINKKVVELFPSLENSMIFLFLVCILIQGFM